MITKKRQNLNPNAKETKNSDILNPETWKSTNPKPT